MKRFLLMAVLLVFAGFGRGALAQNYGAEIYAAGAWGPAPSTSTSNPLSSVQPIHLYCYSSAVSAWVPADSSCFGGGGGSGTVNAGTIGQPAYYAASGTAVSGAPNWLYDVYGNLTSTQSITANSVSSPTIAPLAYRAFGDSITTCATGVTIGSNCYVMHWAYDLGTLVSGSYAATNRSVSGDQSGDVVWRIQSADNPAVSGTPTLYSLLIGTNDANVNGIGPGTWEANYELFHQAAIAWFALPTKTAGSTAATTGTCANDTTFGAVTGEQCTANASTLTFSSFTATTGPVYIFYRVISTDAGTWTYAIDGGTPVSVNTAPPINFTTGNGHTSSMGVIRVSGVAAGSHSIVFTQTHSGTMSILALAAIPTLNYTALPIVVVGDVPNQLDGNLLSTTQAYSADADADIRLLAGDGLHVALAPVNAGLQATTAAADMFNTLHPNDVGHLELYRAFRAAVKETAAYTPPLFYNPASNGVLSVNIQTVTFGGTNNAPAINYTFNVGNSAGSGGGGGALNIFGGSGSNEVLGFYYNGTQTWNWGMYNGGLSTGNALLLRDAVGGKTIISFPNNTLPATSLTGDANGLNFGGIHGVVTIYSAAGTALPTCNAAAKGKDGVVSDATSPTYLGTYTSGGATIAPVFCNGTNWVTH